MKPTSHSETLHQLILQKQEDLKNQEVLLREELIRVSGFINPVKMIQHSIKEFVSDPETKENLLSSAAGLTLGALTRSLLVGKSLNPVKLLAGNVTQMGVSMLIAKNPKTVHKIAGGIVHFIQSVLQKNKNQ